MQVGNASGTPITGGNAITQADAAEQGVVIKPAQNSTVAVASQPTITYSESSGEQSANKMLPRQASCDHGHSACNGTNSKHNRANCQQYINQYAYLHLALAD
ncbi:hypothetical protein ACLB1T_04600 [Escherichia coli]